MEALGIIPIFFNNSFSYPNLAISILLLLFGLGIVVAIAFIRIFQDTLQKHIRMLLDTKGTPFLVGMFALLFFSYISMLYLNSEGKQVSPESVFAMDRVGRDWQSGVIEPAFRLLSHQPFNPTIGYGQSFSILASLGIMMVRPFGICSEQHLDTCSHSLYQVLIFLLYGSFVLMPFVILKSASKRVQGMFIILLFFLGAPGALGIDRGNLDLLYSLILFSLLWQRMKNAKQPLWLCISEASIFSMLINSKITMVPLILGFLLTSEHMVLFLFVFSLGYIGFSYAPFLFGVSSSLFDPITAAVAFKNQLPGAFDYWCSAGNHAVYAVARYAIDCSKQALFEHTSLFTVIVYIVSLPLLFFVLGWSMRDLVFQLLKRSDIRKSILHMKKHRHEWLLLITCMMAAVMNLIPVFSFGYRLFFSLPCILIAYSYSAWKDVQRDVLLSSLFLLMKGMWILNASYLNIFVLLHYYFLITATSHIVLHSMKEHKHSI